MNPFRSAWALGASHNGRPSWSAALRTLPASGPPRSRPERCLPGIGIDTEQNEPLPDRVEELVTVPGESEMLAALARASPETRWDRLLFSAKESVFKAWYPLTGRWLGFEDARLTIDPTGTFSAELLIDGSRKDGERPLTQLHGNFLRAHGLVATAVIVPADIS